MSGLLYYLFVFLAKRLRCRILRLGHNPIEALARLVFTQLDL
jgi:hypothetical protein